MPGKRDPRTMQPPKIFPEMRNAPPIREDPVSNSPYPPSQRSPGEEPPPQRVLSPFSAALAQICSNLFFCLFTFPAASSSRQTPPAREPPNSYHFFFSTSQTPLHSSCPYFSSMSSLLRQRGFPPRHPLFRSGSPRALSPLPPASVLDSSPCLLYPRPFFELGKCVSSRPFLLPTVLFFVYLFPPSWRKSLDRQPLATSGWSLFSARQRFALRYPPPRPLSFLLPRLFPHASFRKVWHLIC